MSTYAAGKLARERYATAEFLQASALMRRFADDPHGAALLGSQFGEGGNSTAQNASEEGTVDGDSASFVDTEFRKGEVSFRRTRFDIVGPFTSVTFWRSRWLFRTPY